MELQKLIEEAKLLEFSYCSMGMRAPLPISSPLVRIASNGPDDFRQTYHEREFVLVDPVVRHTYYSQEILVWSDTIHAHVPELWKLRKAHAMEHGLSLPTRGARGVIGVLSLARPNRPIEPAELEEKKHHIWWLAQATHMAMEVHCLPEMTRLSETELTDREISVLRLLAEGKASDDIAHLLQITRRTIDFHINNAVEKLGVQNRTAATATLAVLGLL